MVGAIVDDLHCIGSKAQVDLVAWRSAVPCPSGPSATSGTEVVRGNLCWWSVLLLHHEFHLLLMLPTVRCPREVAPLGATASGWLASSFAHASPPSQSAGSE
jgi:hypothetical protein